MTTRSHLSIGEVLSLLQEEFPDVTISKIRFLESQGLLDPERTPSGYRKFYEPDIARLRWILRQQRENFLPLKVIKDRLEDADDDAFLYDEVVAGNGHAFAYGLDDEGDHETSPDDVVDGPLPPPGAEAAVAVDVVDEVTAPAARSGSAGSGSSGSASLRAVLDSGETTMVMTADELARATGLTPRQVTELDRFGLISGDHIGSVTNYGEDSLVVANLAAALMRHGVEARHLRMYKLSAEREASFYESMLLPLLKQRSPKTRQQATELLDDLTTLGDAMRTAMLRHALKQHLGRT